MTICMCASLCRSIIGTAQSMGIGIVSDRQSDMDLALAAAAAAGTDGAATDETGEDADAE